MIPAGDTVGFQCRILKEIANGLLRVFALTSAHKDHAGDFIERHGSSDGLRTLDSLQPTVALSLHRAVAVENLAALVAADKVLCKVAATEGMPVTDPESPAL